MSAVEPLLPLPPEIATQISQAAHGTAPVLLLGESGTGKNVVARLIHRLSGRSTRSFQHVDCSTLTEHLTDTHLFGNVRGAYTGATESRKGSVELADGGTLFLDEVGNLRPDLQAKLLTLLQDRKYQRLGESAWREADVRIISATNEDLESLVSTRAFRRDLYHRVAVYTIALPPLRHRSGEMPAIVDMSCEKSGSISSGDIPAVRLASNQPL